MAEMSGSTLLGTDDGSEPVVYAVRKVALDRAGSGLPEPGTSRSDAAGSGAAAGWCFSRREFLAAAGLVTTVTAAAGCASAPAPTPLPTVTPEPTRSPEELAADQRQMACLGTTAHLQATSSLAISPDDGLLATGGWDDNTIKLWSLPDGALLKTLEGHEGATTALAISPDGRLLVSGGADSDIRLWSLPDGARLEIAQGDRVSHFGTVSSLAIGPDGRLLASASVDNTVKLWSLSDGDLLKTLEVQGTRFNSVDISPDGALLAAGSTDKRVRLWSLPEGALLKTLEGHAEGVTCVAFSPDGKQLASMSGDGAIKLWSLPEATLLKTLVENKGVWGLAFSPDGKWLASVNGLTIRLWALPDALRPEVWHTHHADISSFAISRGGEFLALADQSAGLRLFIFPDGLLLGCPMDLAATTEDKKGVTYQVKTAAGEVQTVTQPCDLALPAGAVCTCNCVAGSLRPTGGGGGTQTYYYPN